MSASQQEEWVVLVYREEVDPFRDWLEQHPDNIRRTSRHFMSLGYTPLHMAAKHGRLRIIKLLLGRHRNATDYDILHAKSDNGTNALHVAAFHGKLDVVDYLVDEPGIDLQARCDNGNTALHWAAAGGHEDVVQLLLDCGALSHATNYDLGTPSDLARQYDEIKALECLESFEERNFYQHLDGVRALVSSDGNKKTEAITIVRQLRMARRKIQDMLQLKIFLTAVNAQFRFCTIDKSDQHYLILRALHAAAHFCTSKDVAALFDSVLEYVEKAGIITNHEKHLLKRHVDETCILSSKGIQEMKAMIEQNTEAIGCLHNRMETFEVAVAKTLQEMQENWKMDLEMVQANTEAVAARVNGISDALRFQQRVLAGCNLVSAALNLVSLGSAGGVLNAIAGWTVSEIVTHVVDFGDLEHVRRVFAVGEESELLQAMVERGVEIAENSIADIKLEETLRQENVVVVMAASAAISMPPPNAGVVTALPVNGKRKNGLAGLKPPLHPSQAELDKTTRVVAVGFLVLLFLFVALALYWVNGLILRLYVWIFS